MRSKGLTYYLRIYFKILAQDLKSKMSYRADFIISTIGMIFTNIAGFVGFWILFRNFPSIKDWTYYEMLFLYGFSLVSLTPVQCLFDNNWKLRQYVYSGDFIKYCFRPINLFFYYQSEVFDIKGLGQLAFGIGTLVYSAVKLGIAFTPLMILKLIVFLTTASLIMIALQNAGAATCFWIQNSFYVLDLAFRFKDYAKYPITIFNKFFRFIFTFVMPIAFIAYYPSLVILRPDESHILSWLSPLVGVAFFLVSYKIWMYGAMKYSGTGS
ncbi:MAG: ABC-2 family transporter protein [Oscillospiraceae bacterium]|nr:ABC-2 family transporter protein [Oscillospiraceae bacterium]